MGKLTERQKRFIDYYIQTGNATRAAILAGYSQKTANRIGSENLTKIDIRAAIGERLKSLESSRIANDSEVLERFTRILRREEMESKEIVQTDGNGNKYPVTINIRPSPHVAIEAGKAILKYSQLKAEAEQAEKADGVQLLTKVLTIAWKEKANERTAAGKAKENGTLSGG